MTDKWIGEHGAFGGEIILDLMDCTRLENFRRRPINDVLMPLMRDILKVDLYGFHWWDDFDPDETRPLVDGGRLAGTSVCQFISTSTITIHAMDNLRRVFVNVFSCNDYEPKPVVDAMTEFFGGTIQAYTMIVRGIPSHCQEEKI